MLGSLTVSITDFKNKVENFDNRMGTHEKALQTIQTTVMDLAKSKGESNSKFVVRRTRLSKANIVSDRQADARSILFELKPAYGSLSSSRSARPSAVLGVPHDQALDSLDFEIDISRADDGILLVKIASTPADIGSPQQFLTEKNGLIPLDLTVRTPKE